MAQLLIEAMRPHKEGWLASLDALGKKQLAAIRAERNEQTAEEAAKD